MNTNQTINRYNQDGSENLDYWFGVRETRYQISLVTEKPHYSRYTLDSLKKRSTKRLETMHNNMFGHIDNRQMMIKNLFNKLSYLWAEYTDYVKSVFGMTKEDAEKTGKRGRKPKFEETQIHEMLQMSYHGYRLVDIAEIFETNIATVSQTLNGKGTYAYIVNPRLVIRASKNNRVQ